MASQKTALQLVNETRDKVGTDVLRRDLWRDGWDDPDEPDPSKVDTLEADRAILPRINEVIDRAIRTGYSKCLWRQAITGNQSLYRLSPLVTGIVWVRYAGVPLTPISGATLQNRYPGLYGINNNPNPTGTPQYVIADTYEVLELIPTPIADDLAGAYSLTYLAETASEDLTKTTDTPVRIPSANFGFITDGAAAEIISSIIGDPRYQGQESLAMKYKLYSGRYEKWLDTLQETAQGIFIGQTEQMTPSVQIGGAYDSTRGGYW